jgi:hypothetical protein
MTGKLKTKGNIMLATKLDSVLKARVLIHDCPSLSLQPMWCIGRKSKTMISHEERIFIFVVQYIPVVIQFIIVCMITCKIKNGGCNKLSKQSKYVGLRRGSTSGSSKDRKEVVGN